MLGATFIAGLFLALVLTGIWIATNTRDRHRRLLAIGATVAIGFQAFWHMLVDLLAAPPKGMTLPFISYGGSSMVVSLIFIGILDAVARQSAEETLETTRIGVGARRGSSQNLLPPLKDT
jgi:cell division protein FtsW